MAQAAPAPKSNRHPRPEAPAAPVGQDLASLERRRLRAARMFDRGSTQAEVVRALGVSRQSASRWHRAWAEGGSAALASSGKRGRSARLSSAQLKAVEQALRKGARSQGYATDLWTLDRVGAVIESVTGVTYHRGHVWKVLRSLGWTRQRPARQAAERDDEAIAAWVKTTWPRVKKTPEDGAPA
jgi:transposase